MRAARLKHTKNLHRKNDILSCDESFITQDDILSGGIQMAKLKKTWKEKLYENRKAEVVEITENMSQKWGIGTCVIPAPIEVDEIMKMVPKGKLITINQIRETLARRYDATIG